MNSALLTWENDLVPHSPPAAPPCRSLPEINADIAAVMRAKGGTPVERAARVERYHELLVEYLAAREDGGREAEGEPAAA